MRISRIGAAIATIGVGALVLAGCAANPAANSGLDEGTSINVAWNQPFYSYNGNTSFGNATANNNITSMTIAGFNYYDNEPKLQQDDTFGSYEVIKDDPLTVKYTVNDGVKWSDGTPVDAADMLLDWVANSGVYNADADASATFDDETGAILETTDVYFDGSLGAGLENISKVPEISDDGRSVTLVYDNIFVDWELIFGTDGQMMPAHVVGQYALGIDDPTKSKDAVIKAIQDEDRDALKKIADNWNTIFNFTELPDDPALYLASGPYVIKDFKADQYVTLTANPEYTGAFKPHIEEITVRFITDPLAAVQALANGEVDVISPQATTDVADALGALDGVTVIGGYEGTYEHIDLQFDQSKSGVFNDPLVREAFMKVIPRQQIVDTLITPLMPEAEVRSSAIFLPGAAGYDESIANNGSDAYAEVDVPGATALLAQAGVTNPEVCVLFASTNPRRVNEFQLLQQSAAQAGFNVTDCSSPDWGGLLGTPGKYDASLFGWQSTSLGVTAASPNFKTGGINNMSFYSNPEVDALLTELDTTTDPDRQQEILIDVDKMLWDDFFGVTIFQFPAVTAVSDRVTGVDPSTLAPSIFWNIHDWEVSE